MHFYHHSIKYFMENNIKKRTKHNIHLKSNNYIQETTQKEAFFDELLTTLKSEFDQQSFAFLATCRIYQENPSKKNKTQQKVTTYTKVVTQPDQRAPNINDIDPSIFQQTVSNRNPLKINQLSINPSQSNIFEKKPSTTPRSMLKQEILSNKILNLGNKLDKKYYQQISTRFSEAPSSKTSLSTRAHFFIPKFQAALSSTNRNRTTQSNSRNILKMSIERFTKRNNVTKNGMNFKRLKTSFDSKDDEEIRKFCNFQLPKFRQTSFDFKDLMRKTHIDKRLYSTQRLKTSQDSVPKQFMDQMLFSKRQVKQRQLCREFSDYKRISKFRDTFLC